MAPHGCSIKKGDYLGAVIDSADSTLQPPRPELRKTTVPLGIVGVFGASNFPFAFGVGGCDTAAAIAAGCPVIIKANPGHIETSRKVFALMQAAAKSLSAPEGLFNMVEDFEAGMEFVKHKDLSAVAFTGSTSGGRALFDIAQSRKDPIPFMANWGPESNFCHRRSFCQKCDNHCARILRFSEFRSWAILH